MSNQEILIKGPKKPYINKIIAALVMAALATYIFYLVQSNIFTGHQQKISIIFYIMVLLYIVVFVAFPKIARHCISINYETHELRHEFEIGHFTYKERWQYVDNINYISVFEDKSDYWACMWYEDHKFLNLFSLTNYDEIMEKACYVAHKLNVKLLDATIDDAYNHWVDIEHFQNTREVIYMD